MVKEKLLQLNEAHIRKLAGGRSFERGQGYYQDGAILEPVRQEMELRAECAGSAYEPYQVSATLTKGGIAETSCTCPYDQGGICKHIIALLLTYVHEPQSFRVILPLTAMLAERSKEELIGLIGEMIKREPELLSVVELSAATQQAKSGKPLDVTAYRRQVRRALQHESPRAVEKELRALRETAIRFGKTGEWLNAGAVYHVMLDETVRGYDDMLQQMDEDGDIAIQVDECAQGLSLSLIKSSADGQTRRAWLEALLEAELTDIEIGGIDLAPSAGKAILELASDEEWAWIEKRVRTAIAKSSDWGREALVGFLAEGRERRGRASEAAALIREVGTPEQQVLLLVEEGEIERAVRQMQQILRSKPGLATQFADALVQAGANHAAVDLVAERAQKGDSWCTIWLAKYHRQHGNAEDALAWQQKVFLGQPSVEAFKVLGEVSRKLDRWERVRADVLATLERKKTFSPLIEIALDESDVERALSLLPRVERGAWRDYKWEVAQAAEKKHPEAALMLYKEMAERAIGERQRRSYETAADHLKRVKALSERLNTQAEWGAYLQSLRSQYAHLPALQDEMRKAQLWR
ncbi:MAG: SWIM zinc finger family protein [Acidobacteriota bacterium]|nr:SWIM zinc finger family protein [Acidobacteriota bacterium]